MFRSTTGLSPQIPKCRLQAKPYEQPRKISTITTDTNRTIYLTITLRHATILLAEPQYRTGRAE
jgi:hypothetical protein